jgi:glycosyltransferase involved in cell wall biosynthesis
MEAPPRTSVVIPTFQRRDVVLRSVAALSRQEETAAFEVIVVVDGSTDGTAQALRELETPFPLAVVEQSNEGSAAARNHGAEAARGTVLLFLDDDMEAHPRLLAEHERSRREGADVVLGHIPLHPDSPPGFLAAGVGEWAERRARSLQERAGRVELEDLLTGQMSLPRKAFLRLGGFDTAFTRGGQFGGEDLDFGLRLLESGHRVVFNPDAISRQRYVVTQRQYLRQWRQNGRASVMLARKHPEQLEQAFHRRETRADRLIWRRVRWPLRAFVLALAATGASGPRTTRWFFRVRNLEYFRGIATAGGVPAPRPVHVFCYHSISDLAGARVLEPYGIPPRPFRGQLRLLARWFRFLDADEFERFLDGAGVPRRAALLTFDDCYTDLLDAGLPILEELHLPALAFVVSRRVGGTNEWDASLGAPEMQLVDTEGLRTLAAAGVAIGSHSRTHPLLSRLPPDELADEVEGSLTDLEEAGFRRPAFLAYPYGDHDAAVKKAVAGAGLRGAFTVTLGLARPGGDRYAIPRIEVLRGNWGRFLHQVARAGRV